MYSNKFHCKLIIAKAVRNTDLKTPNDKLLGQSSVIYYLEYSTLTKYTFQYL